MWNEQELGELFRSVGRCTTNQQHVMWTRVGKELNRPWRDCKRQYKRSLGRTSEPWSAYEENVLSGLAKCQDAHEQRTQAMRKAAEQLGTRNDAECSAWLARSAKYDNGLIPCRPMVATKTWSLAELDTLHTYRRQFGPKWKLIAAALPGHSADACRKVYKQWYPGVQSPARKQYVFPESATESLEWPLDEQRRLVWHVNRFGRKWTSIAKLLGGNRGPMACRAKFGSLFK